MHKCDRCGREFSFASEDEAAKTDWHWTKGDGGAVRCEGKFVRLKQRHPVHIFREDLLSVIKVAQAAGVPAFCIRRELSGHLAALAEGEEDGKLWCVAVHGPGTVIPQPSKAVAEARAAPWNEDIEPIAKRSHERYPDQPSVLMVCEAGHWPYSAETHAKRLAEHGGEPEDIT